MPLGWIDFSKSERSKVLSVLDMLSEAGTLDELGIAPIRDGFSNLFFPGTSTIQTRAKYFLIVPYALKDIEYSNETNPNRALRTLDQEERNCGMRFLANGENTEGIIGGRSLGQGRWVRRSPADIYWVGLRNYGIFTGGNLSLTEYIRAACSLKNQKTALIRMGNRNDQAEENEQDDKDAGELFHRRFWNIPTYREEWKEHLDIRLTADEGAFLKKQIISSCPHSMMACILKNRMEAILECRNFQELEHLIRLFPEDVQRDYRLASSFSDFLYVLRIFYNRIVSDGKNENANIELQRVSHNLEQIASVDLERIFERLSIHRNVFLRNFLFKSQSLMRMNDTDGLMTEIKRRERELKQNRAKTLHPGEFSPSDWFGGGQLDYRFGNAKSIIRDIFESEGSPC